VRANTLFAADLTNPDLPVGEGVLLPRGSLHLFRSKFIADRVCHERLRLTHHGLTPLEVTLTVEFDCDFSDIFEIRGMPRARRGELLEPEVGRDTVTHRYR